MKHITRLLLGICSFFLLTHVLFSTNFIKHAQTPVHSFKVIKQYTHFPQAFTQGLYLDAQAHLYESAGLYGYSKLIVYDLQKNNVLKSKNLAAHLFAEGLAILNNQLYLGLYQAKKILIFDKTTLKQIGEIASPVAVWGMTTDGKQLIISDGSSNITFFDVATKQSTHVIKVRDQKRSIKDINALQFNNGNIFANIWHTDLIAKIDANTGQVLAWINLAGLNPNPKRLTGEFVLNGIAYNTERNTLIVTGKFWPTIYEIIWDQT